MKLFNKKIILASSSPFRASILKKAGIIVSRETAHINEREIENKNSGLAINDLALLLAKEKAKKVSTRFPECLVIGCDQLLSCEGIVYHKVSNKKQAQERLEFLSGKKHYLYSSIVIYKNNHLLWQYIAKPCLTMRYLTKEFIENYLQQAGEDVLKTAGIYQIEDLGIRLFKKIQGDYHAIIGLPLLPLLNFLKEKGFIDG